jgi:DNA modification methylase
LCERPILAGSPVGGIVLDPFIGSGTTALVARRLRRRFLGIDLVEEYVALARGRLRGDRSHRSFSPSSDRRTRKTRKPTRKASDAALSFSDETGEAA